MPNEVQGDSGISNLWDKTRVIFYSTEIYANIQAAIDEAEALATSDDDQGVVILLPPGAYSAQDVTIKKNITLQGLGVILKDTAPTTMIGTVTVEPASDVSPRICARLINLVVTSFEVTNELAGPVYNPDSPQFVVSGCYVGNVTARGISIGEFIGCNFVGATQSYIVCETIVFSQCVQVAGIDWHTDDSAAGLPTNYSGGNLQFQDCTQVLVSLTKDGGTITSFFSSRNTDFESITLNGETDIRVNGGSVESVTKLNANNNYIEFQAHAPYGPANAGDWDVLPEFVHTALDELAARVTALEPP